MKNFYIGIFGWLYFYWKEIFYFVDFFYKKRLEFYLKYFFIFEVNFLFYYLLQEKIIINWYNFILEGFIFFVKVLWIIIYLKRLFDVDEEWENFKKRIDLFKEKFGFIFL